MSQFPNDQDRQESDYFQQQTEQTVAEAKSWFSDLPWQAKIGIPTLGIIMIGLGGSLLLGRITNPNPGTLNTSQFASVNAAADKFFSAQTVTVGAQTVSGKLASCSSRDSDGDERVTCTGSVPFQTTVGPEKAPVIAWKPALANCDVPKNGAAGCKPKQ